MKTMLINLTQKYASLMFGLLLYSVGILTTIYAGLGVSPWDAFHLGIVNHTPLTLGQTSQLVGVAIIFLCIPLKVIPGFGTIANMYFIGLFIDIINVSGLIPHAHGLPQQICMLLAGVLIIGWATYFYLSAGMGSGPRDSLMLALTQLLNTRVWIVRTALEVTVVILGYFLGGPIGIGTVVTALLIGPSIQLAFSIMHRDPKAIRHRNIKEEYKLIMSVLTLSINKTETQKAIEK